MGKQYELFNLERQSEALNKVCKSNCSDSPKQNPSVLNEGKVNEEFEKFYSSIRIISEKKNNVITAI